MAFWHLIIVLGITALPMCLTAIGYRLAETKPPISYKTFILRCLLIIGGLLLPGFFIGMSLIMYADKVLSAGYVFGVLSHVAEATALITLYVYGSFIIRRRLCALGWRTWLAYLYGVPILGFGLLVVLLANAQNDQWTLIRRLKSRYALILCTGGAAMVLLGCLSYHMRQVKFEDREVKEIDAFTASDKADEYLLTATLDKAEAVHAQDPDYHAFIFAARKGDAASLRYLGSLFYAGIAVPQNHELAKQLLMLAAELGDSSAAELLGRMLDKGQGGPKDISKAYFWFNIASAHCDQSSSSHACFMLAGERDRLAKELSPDQLSIQQQLALNWTPKTYPTLRPVR